jgi:Na+/H+ antiporter NhaA
MLVWIDDGLLKIILLLIGLYYYVNLLDSYGNYYTMDSMTSLLKFNQNS